RVFLRGRSRPALRLALGLLVARGAADRRGVLLAGGAVVLRTRTGPALVGDFVLLWLRPGPARLRCLLRLVPGNVFRRRVARGPGRLTGPVLRLRRRHVLV